MISIDRIKEAAKRNESKNYKFRTYLKNNADPKKLDRQFRDLHNKIFIQDEYDCSKCANCCKLYDIRVEEKDVPAIAKHLGQTESDFIENYLVRDEEEADGYIFKNKPCGFLEADGKCGIYEVRPSVCKSFPHTNKPDRIFSLLSVIGCVEDCPVVFEIIEELKKMHRFR